MRLSTLACALALVAGCAESKAPPAPSPLVVATDKKTGCTLKVPRLFATRPATAEPVPPAKPWGTATMTWSGACPSKRASGQGVARILSGPKVVGAWYGEAVNGALGRGVIEDANGYEAGQIDARGAMQTLDSGAENALIAQAAKLARGLADSYERAGNKGSAAFYRTKASDIEAMAMGE